MSEKFRWSTGIPRSECRVTTDLRAGFACGTGVQEEGSADQNGLRENAEKFQWVRS